MKKAARKKFRAIFESDAFQSLKGDDLMGLQSYSQLMKLTPHRPSRLVRCIWITVVVALSGVILPAVAFALVHNGYVRNVEFLQGLHRNASYWFMEEIQQVDFESESCMLEPIEAVSDLFRPPVDCGTCRNVTEVVRVSGISPEEFEERFAYSGAPVVITDAMRDWSAQETLSYEYLRAVYQNDSKALDMKGSDCQFFPYRTRFESLREVFDMSSERARLEDGSKPWYIGWSNCASLVANTLRQHYQRPYFLPTQSESSETDWIFMGSPGYGAPMHIDDVDFPSWQAQIRGTKRWILEPPPECYMECQIVDVVVHPGEVIVLDTNKWFHQTMIKGDDLSITIGSEYD